MSSSVSSAPVHTFSDTSSDSVGGTSQSGAIPNEYIRESPQDVETPANETKKKGRKGHTKSRKGCLNCKRVRIKCKENRPSCDYCAHRDLICEWPDMQVNQVGTLIRNTNSPAPVLPCESRSGTSSFSMESSSIATIPIAPQSQVEPVFNMLDFKLFHHFIDEAYPHHPIGNDSVWTHEIPSIASNYDFLLHAMLALSASDLADREPSLNINNQLTFSGMSHRIQAISALNAAISQGLSSFEQGNAMLATCFSLLFQSVLIDDGLAEYMTFIRGTVAVGFQMGMRNMQFLFGQLFENRDLKSIDPLMMKAPLIAPELVAVALRSIERLEPLCEHEVEREIFCKLLSTARALVTSSRDGYMELRKIYGAFSYTMPHSSFAYLITPSNKICQLLQSHFVALQLTMTPITKNEWSAKNIARGKMNKNGVTVGWFKALHRNVPDELREFYRWPMWVEQEVKEGRIYNGVVRMEGCVGGAF